MVVLAACICTREGKTVLSRQFVEVPKWRLEALLAEFPSLAEANSQHTTVEHKNVRFVYQPLDNLYLVLILTKDSNILLDMSLLNLFSQVLSQICNTSDEREIGQNAFEIIIAFDELVSSGYPDNLNLFQVKTFLAMKSHEEEIQEIITKNKEYEARAESKRRARQLEMERRLKASGGGSGGGGYSSSHYETPMSSSTPLYSMASQTSTVDSKPNFNRAPPKGMKLTSKKTLIGTD